MPSRPTHALIPTTILNPKHAHIGCETSLAQQTHTNPFHLWTYKLPKVQSLGRSVQIVAPIIWHYTAGERPKTPINKPFGIFNVKEPFDNTVFVTLESNSQS